MMASDAEDNPPRLLMQLRQWFGAKRGEKCPEAQRLARCRDSGEARDILESFPDGRVETLRDHEGEDALAYYFAPYGVDGVIHTGEDLLYYDLTRDTFGVASSVEIMELRGERASEQRGEAREAVLEYRARLVAAMADTLWVSAWADWADENLERADRPPPGSDYSDYAPDTPPSAHAAAEMLTVLIELASKGEITGLLWRAQQADGYDMSHLSWLQYAQDFGSDLAMMALGTGVSWFDDHAPFPDLKYPHIEAHTPDGETLYASGLE